MQEHPKYSNLFSPLQVGNTCLKNRILMGSMHTSLEDLDDGGVRMAAYFAESAAAGVGLIITGGIGPNLESGQGAKLLSENWPPLFGLKFRNQYLRRRL